MSFKFKCPDCGKMLAAEDEWIGKQTVCPACQAEITIQPESEPCPECGEPAKPDAVLCTECGYNFQTGKKLKSKIVKSKPEKTYKFRRTSKFFYMLEGGMYLWIAGIINVLLFIAYLVLFLMKNFEAAEMLGKTFVIEAAFFSIVASIMMLVASFSTGIFWGLGVLFVPFVSLLFVICHWSKAKKAFILALTAAAIAFCGVLMISFAQYAGKKQEPITAEAIVEVQTEKPETSGGK